MPKPFDNCRKKGGKVRTKKLSKGRYMHVCSIGGKSYAGHVKHKKTQDRRVGRAMKRAIGS